MNLEIELRVKEIFESQNTAGAFTLLLENKENTKQLIPVIIGEKETHAIYCSLNDIKNSRPLTHDLMTSCFSFTETKLIKVLIYKVTGGVYYSYIYLKHNEQFTRIDARTSDAIALALRLTAPIYILKDILESESIQIVMDSEETDMDTIPLAPTSISELQKKLDKAIQQENYELASVLRDQIAEIEAQK